MEVLEECLLDERREISKLWAIWDSGVKRESDSQSVKSVKWRILEELEGYWRMLAQQGRSLEEAAR